MPRGPRPYSETELPKVAGPAFRVRVTRAARAALLELARYERASMAEVLSMLILAEHAAHVGRRRPRAT